MGRLLPRSICLIASLFCALLAPPVFAQDDQRSLVTAATVTFANFRDDPGMSWLHHNLRRAKAVLIAPGITKAGFILGGSGGRAVVVARDPKSGKWAGPAFYTLATASVGFQAGLAVTEMVTLVMTENGLDSLLADSFKMGGDATVAAGPVGAGAQADLVADFVSFSRATGVYGGVNFDGTIVAPSEQWNQIYYGKPVHATDILVRMSVHNKQATELLNLVTAATRAQ
jgi:lipid-binding SYLF domain-containing protein